MSWIIKGEAGKTLDATARSFADLNISGCLLKFQSLAYDQLTWQAGTLNASGAGTIVPDYGQIVELWWNSTRKFRGHVTGVVNSAKTISITIDGPWWWMERTNLTEVLADATGVTAERHSYVFPTQSLATSLASLITRAITRMTPKDVPMTAGSVAAMFNVPQMTLAEQSYANAMAALMAWCPDSVAWFDYSGTGDPTLNITRRGALGAVTYTVATDAVEIGDITPRMDLEVSRNELHYVVRQAVTGLPAWASQVSGTDVAGKRQIVTVSGPEIVAFLPKDDVESYPLQTMALTTVFAGNLVMMDSSVKSMFDTYGIGRDTYYWAPVAINYFYTGGTPPQNKAHFFPGGTCKTAAGVALVLASYHLIISASPPSWLTDQGLEVTLSQWFVMLEQPAAQGYSPAFGAWRQTATDVGVDTCSLETPGNVNWAAREVRITGWVLPNAKGHTALTTVYKPWEYDFVAPPAGLAAALVGAQNWVPWEGPITLVSDECSGDNLLPNKFNLANALPACATMGALAKDVVHDLMRGRTTIDLGAPARVDFSTLVSRVRTDPKDSIVYL